MAITACALSLSHRTSELSSSMLRHCTPSAHFAATATIGQFLQVVALQWVTLIAMGFAGVARRLTLPPRPIDPWRNWFKVPRVHASSVWTVAVVSTSVTGAVVAEMVKMQAIRNRTNQQFVGDSVGVCDTLGPGLLECTVASIKNPRDPRPACLRAAAAIHFGPETISHGKGSSAALANNVGAARSAPAGVVHFTPATGANRARTIIDRAELRHPSIVMPWRSNGRRQSAERACLWR